MKIIKNISWLLFPRRCACCNKIIGRDEKVCDVCRTKLIKSKKICLKCGSDKKNCSCKFNTYHFKGCIGPFMKSDESMLIIHHFKDEDNIAVADYISDEMFNEIGRYYGDINFDGVCAVPSHWTKKFYKGYNQSEILARQISKRISASYFTNLYKCKKTQVQHTLKRQERFENVRNAYACKPFENCKNILLIDDIKSTGATLDECSRQLMFAGAENVYCAVAILNSANGCKIQK